MQKALCGEGAPNLLLSSVLFDLARSEVFAEDDPRIAAELTDTKNTNTNTSGGISKTQMKFFAGEFGSSSVFQGVNEKGDPFVTVYAKIWKCGNNQIRFMEKKLFKHLNGTYTDNLQLSHILGRFLRNIYESGDDAIMPPPCIYTAIRDPISHFLSGYNEVEVRQLGEYNNQSHPDWPTHSKPAPYHRKYPYSNESSDLRRHRFEAFVEDLLLEEPTFGNNYVYSHFFAMSRILVILKKYNSGLTGYIPQLDNITATWPSFLSSECANFPSKESIPAMTKQGQHRSSRDRLGLYQAAKEVWQEEGPVARSLCLLHAFDYACFEDLPEKIPSLCRSVYQDHAETIVRVGTKNYFTYSKGGG